MSEKIRVLIVDDQQYLARAFAERLNHNGLQADGVETVEAALFQLENTAVEVLWADKGIARSAEIPIEQDSHGTTGGGSLLEFVRETQPYCRTILMTGEQNLESVAHEWGVWGYVWKPLDDDVATTVSRMGFLHPDEQDQAPFDIHGFFDIE